MRFSLSERADLKTLQSQFARSGRVHVAQLLEVAAAQALHQSLATSRAWKLLFNKGDLIYELDPQQQADIGAQKMGELQTAVTAEARDKFQHLYETIRVPQDTSSAVALLDGFAAFINSDPFLDFARQVTGRAEIAFADCQATRYRAGHFLTTHDDGVAGKGRVAAYVLNLTPKWSPHWGGQLQFLSPDGHIEQAFVPCFNALNMFSVPQPHLVSTVGPAALIRDDARISITGWLRI